MLMLACLVVQGYLCIPIYKLGPLHGFSPQVDNLTVAFAKDRKKQRSSRSELFSRSWQDPRHRRRVRQWQVYDLPCHHGATTFIGTGPNGVSTYICQITLPKTCFRSLMLSFAAIEAEHVHDFQNL